MCALPGSRRLLLIACNENFRRTLGRILHRCGYLVDAIESGEGALTRLQATAYDGIISEVFLPGNVCGLTLLGRVRKDYPNLPVILLTEGETARMRSMLDQCAGVKCLPLPVDVDQLKALIANWAG